MMEKMNEIQTENQKRHNKDLKSVVDAFRMIGTMESFSSQY